MPSLVPSSPMRSIAHVAGDLSAWTSNLYPLPQKPILGHPSGLWVNIRVALQFALGRTDPGKRSAEFWKQAQGHWGRESCMCGGWVRRGSLRVLWAPPLPPPNFPSSEERQRWSKARAGGFQRVGSRAEVNCPGQSQNEKRCHWDAWNKKQAKFRLMHCRSKTNRASR